MDHLLSQRYCIRSVSSNWGAFHTPYGTLLARDSAGSSMPKGFHVGWTGREYDAETGFTFHRARYYSADLRRWTQEDPIGYAGGGNLYAYVGGAVMEARDPSGLMEDLSGRGLGFAEASRPNENYERPPWPGGGGGRGGWLNSSHIADDGYLDRLMDAIRQSQQGNQSGRDPNLQRVKDECNMNPVCKSARQFIETFAPIDYRVGTKDCPNPSYPCQGFDNSTGRYVYIVNLGVTRADMTRYGESVGLPVDGGILLAHEFGHGIASMNKIPNFSPLSNRISVDYENEARRWMTQATGQNYGQRRVH